MPEQNLEQRAKPSKGIDIAVGSTATLLGGSLAGLWEYALHLHRMNGGEVIIRFNDLFHVPAWDYDRLLTAVGAGVAAAGIYILVDTLKK